MVTQRYLPPYVTFIRPPNDSREVLCFTAVLFYVFFETSNLLGRGAAPL